MTALLHLLARAADRLLSARLAPYTLDAPGPAVPSPAGSGVTSPTT